MNILNKFKRGMAALLSLSVAVSAVFVFHFPLMKAHAEENDSEPVHNDDHCFCGESECDHDDVAEEAWEAWEENDSLPSERLNPDGGYFYLTKDVTIADSWKPANNTYLCLNGHDITMVLNDIDVIYISKTVTFTLCDCKGGGTISGNDGDENSCGVYNEGTFNMYGGTISGNVNGVYNCGTMTVGGTANITGNTDSNVYLPKGFEVITIDSKAPLKDDASIGVTAEELLSEEGDEPETIDEGAGSDDTEGGSVPDDLLIAQFTDADVNNPAYEYIHTFFSSDVDRINVSYNDEGDESDTGVFLTYENATKPGDGEESGGNGDDEGDGDEKKHTHGGIDCIEWTEENVLPTDGNYFLTKNVTLNGTQDISGNVTLCLNGKSVTINSDNPAISVTGSLTVYDCDLEDKKEGDIYNEKGNAVTIKGGSFAMYSGTIRGTGGSGVAFEADENDNLGTLTVGGKAKILNAVVLPDRKYINVDNLEKGAEIWVETETEPKAADGETPAVNIQITDANNDDYTKFFHSKTSDYTFIKGDDNDIWLAVKTQETPDEHIHKICGHTGNCGDNISGNVDWTKWESTDSLPRTGGHYYLANDVELPDIHWSVSEKIELCLNGHSIKMNGNSNIISQTVDLTICDCQDKGVITHINGTTGVGVDAGAAKFEMYGGTITGNSVGVFGAGTYPLIIGGTAKITGNTTANVYLRTGKTITVSSDIPLRFGASIGVTTETEPSDGNPVAITGTNSKNITSYFTSDKGYYVVNGAGNMVMLSTEEPSVVEPPVEPTKHTHPLCGDKTCKDHIDLEWEEWNSTTSLPAEAGSYYLTSNVTLTSRWNAASDINLCLNGYTITMNGDSTAVYVAQDLVICDCSTRASDGTITHAANRSGRGVYIASGAALTMYGGIIKGNSSDNGAGVYNDGTFKMLGGYIMNNTATNAGGGLYNDGFATIEGEISENTASKKGGGVYQDGKLTVDADAYILSNTVGSSKNNVYITDGSRIVIGSQFNGSVGVTSETSPKTNSAVTFATGSITKYTVDKIKSDSSSFKIVKSGDKLTLAKKSSSSSDYDDDDSDLELEISAPLSSDVIPKADRTAIINLLKTMPNWVVGAYYDVTLYEDGDETGDAGESLTVKLTIPSSIRAANREYKVIRVHDGKATLLDGTVDSGNTTITVKSRYFSTYAIIYSVSQSGTASGIGTGNGSGTSSNGGYGNPAMGVQNEIPLAGLACGFTVMALAAPGKKLD